jgi:hypothetical protein
MTPAHAKQGHGAIQPQPRAPSRAIAERRARGEPWFGFDRLFDGDPDLFYGPVHTFDDGHERIAERMLEVLRETGSLARAGAGSDGRKGERA